MGTSFFFENQGFGLGFRSAYFEIFEQQKPKSVSWLEILSENYMSWKNHAVEGLSPRLLNLRKDYPMAMHGVSMSLGSTDELDKIYMKSLSELIEKVEPLWVSDHLCWTGVDGKNTHDLLPLPYTQEAVKVVVEKISKAQDFLKRRILVENVSSYVEFSFSEMAEWEFISEVAERADCGILLDINNVYVSSKNHGFDPLKYLSTIPYKRVGQIHLAGHTNKGTHLIDTHDAPVCEDVWALLRLVSENYGATNVMVERDANLPPWSELEGELLRAQSICEKKRETNEFKNSSATI